MAKLSKAQEGVMARIRSGATLYSVFDVYGGYWHELRPCFDRVRPETAAALSNAGLLRLGEKARPYSGRHETPYIAVE